MDASARGRLLFAGCEIAHGVEVALFVRIDALAADHAAVFPVGALLYCQFVTRQAAWVAAFVAWKGSGQLAAAIFALPYHRCTIMKLKALLIKATRRR